jgi:hypothetical protein
MMRASVALGCVLAAACASSNSVRRSLVTDDLHYDEPRDDVRAWHDAHGWCQRVSGDVLDDFTACHVAMLAPHTPPVESLVEYREGRVEAFAVFVPVPCRVTGRCDQMSRSTGPRWLPRPGESFVHYMADLGLHQVPPDEIPSMQRQTLDALEVELDHRYGPPIWSNAVRSAMRWNAQQGEHIALFLDARGYQVIETHVFLPP